MALPSSCPLRIELTLATLRPPRMILRPPPGYSEEARKARPEGTVRLAGVVGVDGTLRDIRVVTPLGMGLDEAAIAAAQQWRFEPGMRGGVPVPVRVTLEINFRLQEGPDPPSQ
jgi:TonB family protein